MKRSWFRRILVVVAIILLVAIVGFVVWAGTPAGALMPQAVAALKSDPSVSVTSDRWLTFTPDTAATTGFIFYPGGRVLPEAYAPEMRAIAEAGYLVVVPAMPLNLAVFAPNTAADVIAAHPEIEYWVIGGHSLGGSMAANFVHAHPDAVEGIVLWASYPQASDSLADLDLSAASIYGTRDGLVSAENIAESRANLPADAVFVSIDGGNHAQFGAYGPQGGDNEADISRDEQQQQTVAATLAVLESVD